METLTIETIRSWGPCYDPTKFASANWSGTILNILRHPGIPAPDKVWCAYRVMTKLQAVEFANNCAARAKEYAESAAAPYAAAAARYAAAAAAAARYAAAPYAAAAARYAAAVAAHCAAAAAAAAAADADAAERKLQVKDLVRIFKGG